MPYSLCIVFFLSRLVPSESTWLKDLNLPRQLLEYHVSTNSVYRQRCIQDPDCKIDVSRDVLLALIQ